MKYYKVSVSKTVLAEIEEISDFIISISTPEHAIRYKNQIIGEIATLSYLGGIINYHNGNWQKGIIPKRNVILQKIRNGT